MFRYSSLLFSRRARKPARSTVLDDAQALQHPPPRGAALRIGNIDEPADLAQHGVLERIEHAVSIGDFPQHLDQLDPPLRRHALVDGAGEAEELRRPLRLAFAN